MRAVSLTASLALVCTALPVQAADRDAASKTIGEAVRANLQVDALGFQGRDTYSKSIGPAKEAYREGNYTKAEHFADLATESAEQGILQYHAARKAQPRV